MRLRLLLPTFVYLAILSLSSLPADGLSMLPPGIGWIGHVVEYTVLGATLRWALEDVGNATAITIAAVVALAGIDEVYQSTVPGRDPSTLDWLTDVTAATIAASVFSKWHA